MDKISMQMNRRYRLNLIAETTEEIEREKMRDKKFPWGQLFFSIFVGAIVSYWASAFLVLLLRMWVK